MTASSNRVGALVDVFGECPTAELIANLDTRVQRFECGGLQMPITVNDGDMLGNCYICNPITGYVDYAIDETRNFVSHPMLRAGLTGLIHATAPMVRATGLDRAVHVNNWLFSTNPAPAVNRSFAADLRDGLIARYGTHAIVLRSLNTHSDTAAMAALQAEGFHLVPSRQVYLFDGAAPPKPSRDFKADQRLLRKTPHQRISGNAFEPADFTRCEELYRQLYLEKYSPLNPQYAARYLAEMHREELLHLEGFRSEDGDLVAFGGRFQLGQTLTQPLLGYDTTRPQKEGLYRLITAVAFNQAIDKGLLFNMSAGAAGFKRHRGAFPAIEYSAVYIRHLPARQRISLRAMRSVLAGIGVPLLKRFAL